MTTEHTRHLALLQHHLTRAQRAALALGDLAEATPPWRDLNWIEQTLDVLRANLSQWLDLEAAEYAADLEAVPEPTDGPGAPSPARARALVLSLRRKYPR